MLNTMTDTENSHPPSRDLSEDEFDPTKPDLPLTDETAPKVGPEDFGRLRRDPVTEDTVGKAITILQITVKTNLMNWLDGVSRTFTPTFGPQIWFPPSSSIDTKGFRNPDGTHGEQDSSRCTYPCLTFPGPRKRVRQTPML